jgi:platelet-activating factor acetylhydrolase IB subunit alpha
MIRNLVSSLAFFPPSTLLTHFVPPSLQAGHDNWVRALAFHPSGKYLLSSSDDKTIRVWELSTGRCVKTVEAHSHFVATLAWGRQPAGGASEKKGVNGVEGVDSGEPEKLVNVVATGSVDQTIKIWLP